MACHRGRFWALLCAVLVVGIGVGVGVANADYVVLDNGRVLKGEIEEESEQGVRMKLPGGSVMLPRARIKKVHRGDEPPPAEAGTRVAHQGEGSDEIAEYRYLDGLDPETGKVRMPKFSVMIPIGELAHGTLVQLRERRVINGIEMARVRVGELDGWVPAGWLRKAPATPVLR